MMPQVPTPPAPPFDPNLLFLSSDAPKMVLIIVVASLIAATIILRPVMRALARRLENKGAEPTLRGEMATMRDRLTELEALQARVAELEERLDFTERLLAQGQATAPTIRGEQR
jgi:Tfp pilus assembly protein PilO